MLLSLDLPHLILFADFSLHLVLPLQSRVHHCHRVHNETQVHYLGCIWLCFTRRRRTTVCSIDPLTHKRMLLYSLNYRLPPHLRLRKNVLSKVGYKRSSLVYFGRLLRLLKSSFVLSTCNTWNKPRDYLLLPTEHGLH